MHSLVGFIVANLTAPATASFMAPSPGRVRFVWRALLALAVLTYLWGLGGQYIPSNGDELVYSHIARVTAATGHWLPLASDLVGTRNTKPPLLFWQAMVAGNWGAHWSQWALRAPSVMYTLAVTALIFAATRRLSPSPVTPYIASCVYLAFFCTFRFGRPYLTSAAETFWFGLPLFCLLWLRLRPSPAPAPAPEPVAAQPGWWAYGAFGLFIGLGLAYKSFALVVPATATLWAAALLSGPALSWRLVVRSSLQALLTAVIAVGIFALWFVLDPDPQAVWQEFVVAENAGKMSNAQGYWQIALRGGDFSMGAQALAYVQNAGLLCFVVLGFASLALRTGWSRWRTSGPLRSLPRALSPGVLVLAVWLVVWLAVFMVPSQRSARYVIPAMPALAMLLALYWGRIARLWFLLAAVLCAVFIAAFGWISWSQALVDIGEDAQLLEALTLCAVGLAFVAAAFVRPQWSRFATLAACFFVYLCFAFTTAPLEGPQGQYDAATIASVQHLKIAAPNNFNGQYERFEFLLPGNHFAPYNSEKTDAANADEKAQTLATLLATHDAVLWLGSNAAQTQPPCVPGCKVLGQRWEIKGRQQAGEITWATLPHPQQWLFRREWLIAGASYTRP